MDYENLDQITALATERRAIQRAVELLKADGRIVSMTISGNSGMASLPTQYITYPQQMVVGIETALQGRLKEIADELAKLGVTGIPEAEPAKAGKK